MARLKRNARRTVAKPIDTRLRALRADLDSLQEHARGLVGEAGNAANDGAQVAIEAARKVAERAYTIAEEAVESVTGDVEEWASDNLDVAREMVREQPLAALAVAMGIGAVLGAFFLRR
jgi:ElaB/YqjD/DUF883 family membrane-anchored ribosome-binding protein